MWLGDTVRAALRLHPLTRTEDRLDASLPLVVQSGMDVDPSAKQDYYIFFLSLLHLKLKHCSSHEALTAILWLWDMYFFKTAANYFNYSNYDIYVK